MGGSGEGPLKHDPRTSGSGTTTPFLPSLPNLSPPLPSQPLPFLPLLSYPIIFTPFCLRRQLERDKVEQEKRLEMLGCNGFRVPLVASND